MGLNEYTMTTFSLIKHSLSCAITTLATHKNIDFSYASLFYILSILLYLLYFLASNNSII